MNLRLLARAATAVSLAFPICGVGCSQTEYVAAEPIERVDWEFGASDGGVGGAGGGSGEQDHKLSLERFEAAQHAFELFMDECATFDGQDHSLPPYDSVPFWSSLLECRVASGVCASNEQYLCAEYPDEWNECFVSFAYFECNDGTLIPGDRQCDTIPNCPDAEEELGCQDLWYQCEDGTPILASGRCDAEVQCPDGSDEFDCDFDYFRCDYDNGIPSWNVCDGYYDCADQSDEKQDCASADCD